MIDPLLNPADLQTYLHAHGISGEIIHLAAPTPTVETAAQAMETSPEHIVKSILFLVLDQPVLAITCGTAHVNYRALAAIYGINRKRIKLASPEVVMSIAGYEVGAMPPFGHRVPLSTVIDQRVLEQSVVYAGGGAENVLVRLSPIDILRVTQARIEDLLNPPVEG